MTIGPSAVPFLAAELAAEPVWREAQLEVPSPAGVSQRFADFISVEQALHILLLVHKAEGTADFHRNIGFPGNIAVIRAFRGKNLVWRSGVVTLERLECRAFVFDRLWEISHHPASALRPQTICITDTEGRLQAWKEVGGEPRYISAALEEEDEEVILKITCDERRHPGPGIYSYGLSRRGIEPLGAEYPGD